MSIRTRVMPARLSPSLLHTSRHACHALLQAKAHPETIRQITSSLRRLRCFLLQRRLCGLRCDFKVHPSQPPPLLLSSSNQITPRHRLPTNDAADHPALNFSSCRRNRGSLPPPPLIPLKMPMLPNWNSPSAPRKPRMRRRWQKRPGNRPSGSWS